MNWTPIVGAGASVIVAGLLLFFALCIWARHHFRVHGLPDDADDDE